jgi:hypothetical protein
MGLGEALRAWEHCNLVSSVGRVSAVFVLGTPDVRTYNILYAIEIYNMLK